MTNGAEIREIAIRCQACNQRCDLEDAVKRGWRACACCGSFVCDLCLNDFGESFPCLSSVCLSQNRLFDPEPIPVDRVVVFARAQQLLEMEDSFLSRLFFEDVVGRGIEPYALQAVREEDRGDGDDQTRVRTETWQGHHLVITRRRRGKFVTWERVY